MWSLLQPSYWFTMNPPEFGGMIGNIVFSIFLLCFVTGIVGRIISDKSATYYSRLINRRISNLFFTMGLLGLILFFFGFERVQLFGARFWYPLWLLIALVWAGLLVRFVVREIPAMRERHGLSAIREKYLPGKKKSKK